MKRFLIRLTAVSLLLCLLAGMVGAVPAGYDFPEDWSRDALIFAVENGVFQGDQHGDLRPKASITRAEMAAVLVRLLGAEEQADLSGFTDVQAEAWYYPELAAAVAAGIFNGVTETEMAPNAPITREQAVTVICRAFGIAAQTRENGFKDAASISAYARDHVSAMTALGHVSGYTDGSFQPKKSISRAEVAQLIYKLFDVIADTPEEITADGSVLYRGTAALPAVLEHRGDLMIGCGLAETLTVTDWDVSGALRLRAAGTEALDLTGLEAESLTLACTGDFSGGDVDEVWLWGDAVAYRGDADFLGAVGGELSAEGSFDTVELRSGTLALAGTAGTVTLDRRTTLILDGTAQEVLLPDRDCTVRGSGYAETVLAYEKNARVSVEYGSFTDYYGEEYYAALSIVKTMRVPCKVLYDTSLYSDRNLSTYLCDVPAGTTVYNEWHPDSYSICVSMSNGMKGFIPGWACQIDTAAVTTNGSLDYSDAVKEGLVDLRSYDSKTEYLIWVSRYTQKVIVYQGSKGDWTVIRTMDCSTGCNYTITPSGVFEISYRVPCWNFGDYYVNLVSGFNGGHAFHTVTYKPDGGYLDGRLGIPLSQGCVRLMPENAEYIYGLPEGTRVIVY